MVKETTWMPFMQPSLDHYTIGPQRRAFNGSLVYVLGSHNIDVWLRTTLAAPTFVLLLLCATSEYKSP